MLGLWVSNLVRTDFVVIIFVHVLPLVLLILSMELVNPYASCALLALTVTLVPLVVIRYVIVPLAPTEVTTLRGRCTGPAGPRA